MKPQYTQGIKSWAVEDRPREKMILQGHKALTNSELIAILIGSGTRKESAIEVAQKVLKLADNNLNNLGRKTLKDLQKIAGIGEAKAISIMAALELGRRKQQTEALERKKISSSSDAFAYFQPLIGDLPHEEFWVLILNRANKILGSERISSGGVSGTVADIKMVFKYALDNLSSAIIVAHNHPSGNLMPSQADKKLTKKIKEAGTVLDVSVLDHIIVTDTDFFSFADEAMM